MIHSPLLLGLGTILLVIGALLWRWSSRHFIDLKSAAIGGAWDAARNRRIPGMPDQFKPHIDAVKAQDTNIGRAKVVGGSVIRHFVARFVGLAAVAGLLGGVALIALSVLWK